MAVEEGWSHFGDRRHHLSQQTNDVSRHENKVAAAVFQPHSGATPS